VTLAVTGDTYHSRRVDRRQALQVSQKHRLPLTGNRWDIRWPIGRRKKPTFSVFPLLSVTKRKRVVTLAVIADTFSCRVVRRQALPVFQGH
jgi:hypothetical protein